MLAARRWSFSARLLVLIRMSSSPLAATGFYQGGMEYPNIVFLSNQFYGPEDAETLEYVTVHETAHQWWYGVVGNNQVVQRPG
jgi:hypothetical protein